MVVKRKLIGKYFIVFLIFALLSAVFFCVTLFFEMHFYSGTIINGVNVSFDSAAEADRKLANWASAYVLVLNERGNVKEQIYGNEIGLHSDGSRSGLILKKEQNKTHWFLSFFDRDARNIGNAFTYDEILLEKRYGELGCVDSSKVVAPKNATLVYNNGVYEVVKEVYGNKINDAMLYSGIKYSVKDGLTELDLEKIECYVNPVIKSDSQKVADTKTAVEKYVSSKIIYTYLGGNETVDANEIGEWIEFEEDLDVIFNTEKIRSYLNALSDHYNTYGKERDFATTSGKKIQIGGGDYGWKVDTKKESEALIEAMMGGRITVREPIYSQRGAQPGLNDIGSTYVEIDLTNQHLWYYKGGKLIVNGAVVTGDVQDGFKTPEGIYSLKYKIKNAVLKGANYRASVTYWMPFNNDIGIHDASWRTHFGRDIYLARGSHGCINVAYYTAETLYNNISVGTPIICYY